MKKTLFYYSQILLNLSHFDAVSVLLVSSYKHLTKNHKHLKTTMEYNNIHCLSTPSSRQNHYNDRKDPFNSLLLPF